MQKLVVRPVLMRVVQKTKCVQFARVVFACSHNIEIRLCIELTRHATNQRNFSNSSYFIFVVHINLNFSNLVRSYHNRHILPNSFVPNRNVHFISYPRMHIIMANDHSNMTIQFILCKDSARNMRLPLHSCIFY